MLKKLVASLAVAALAGLVGCHDGVVSPPADDFLGAEDVLTSGQLASVALESDEMTDALLDAELAVQPAASASVGADIVEIQFNRTHSCPAGGQVAVDGSLIITRDSVTRTVEATLNGTRTRTDCAFVRGDQTITVNGSATLEAFRRRVEGRPEGLQTTSYQGSFHAVASGGGERSCDFAIEVVVDPDARTRTIEGTICGDSVRRVVTWGP